MLYYSCNYTYYTSPFSSAVLIHLLMDFRLKIRIGPQHAWAGRSHCKLSVVRQVPPSFSWKSSSCNHRKYPNYVTFNEEKTTDSISPPQSSTNYLDSTLNHINYFDICVHMLINTYPPKKERCQGQAQKVAWQHASHWPTGHLEALRCPSFVATQWVSEEFRSGQNTAQNTAENSVDILKHNPFTSSYRAGPKLFEPSSLVSCKSAPSSTHSQQNKARQLHGTWNRSTRLKVTFKGHEEVAGHMPPAKGPARAPFIAPPKRGSSFRCGQQEIRWKAPGAKAFFLYLGRNSEKSLTELYTIRISGLVWILRSSRSSGHGTH